MVRGDKKWSEWSTCNKDCFKVRRRTCNSKLNSNMNVQEDCMGKDIETVVCDDGECNSEVGLTTSGEYSDRIVYFSLIIVCTLCVIFAILFAHAKNRKRRVPSFATDDGKSIAICLVLVDLLKFVVGSNPPSNHSIIL